MRSRGVLAGTGHPLNGSDAVKTKHVVAMSGVVMMAGLVGCESNRNNDRSYGSTSNTATGTGLGGSRGYFTHEDRSSEHGGTGYSTPSTRSGNYDNTNTRPRNTNQPGMGMVNDKAKDGCCAKPCDEAKQY